MRITLIQPAQGSRFGFTKVLRVEPLGLECVGAALGQGGHEVRLLDLRLDPPSALDEHLRQFAPSAVGISCGFTSDVYTALDTARRVRERLPDAPIFVGGHHASLIPGDFLFAGSPVDAVVIGEGEITAVELASAFDRGDDPSVVPGVLTLANRSRGFLPRPFVDDLDALPLPDRRLTLRYRRRYHHGFSTPSACVETTRGCPFDCNFCSIWVFYQRRARRRSAARIVEDLEQVARLGERNVFFTDDIAFLQRDAYEELADRIERKHLDFHYACETRADLVVKYRDLFRRWKDIGMDTIFLGVEKVDDDGLDSVRKRTKGGANTNLDAIDALRAADITPMTSLIADPDWGDDDFERLERFVVQTDLPNPTFTILTPLPGTELWQSAKDRLVTDDYAYFDVIHLVLRARLGAERFYQRFARLYRLAESRTHLGWDALASVVSMGLRGKGWVMRRVFGAVRDMRNPRGYLAYPGSLTKPSFVPRGFGAADWVAAGRSYLALRIARPTGSAAAG
jgi:magnesium-protoporphyrin IX monomethyl ester (oxidative) cyclase